MENKYRGTIVVDIDGVLADFEGAFCERFGEKDRNEPNLFIRYPEYSDLIEEFLQSREAYQGLHPIFGGILLARQASYRGYYILLMTSRPRHLKYVTGQWLAWYSVPYDELLFAKDKSEEILTFDQLNPDKPVVLWVDDLVENFNGSKSLVNKIIWERPWNSELGTGTDYWYARYNTDLRRIEVETGFDSVSNIWVDFWTGK